MKTTYIESNPVKWNSADYGTKLTKALTEKYGETSLIKVDYGCTAAYMSIYMRKDVYEYLLKGKYKVDPKSTKTLVILDEQGKTIIPISKDLIY